MSRPEYESLLTSVKNRTPRGQRRIQLLLDTAEQLFGELGFEATTTNMIAARADVSPASVYQFFPNKDAIAEALANRYLELLRATQAYSFAPEIVHLPLAALIDRVVDPLVALHLAHPGFLSIFSGVSPRVSAAAQQFFGAIQARAEAVFALRAPHLSTVQRIRCARISVQLVRALLPLVVAADVAERDAVVAEIKAAQYGYLAPIFGEPVPVRLASRQQRPAATRGRATRKANSPS